MSTRRARWSLAVGSLALTLAACQSEPPPLPPPPPEPEQALPPAPPADPPPRPRLSAEDELFWFGPRGAPPPLGDPGPAAPAPPPEDGDPPAYVLGAGDVIMLRIPEDPTYDREVLVAPDGTIGLDLVGTVRAGGKTLPELTTELQGAFKKYLRKASPVVTLKTPRPQPPDEVVVVGPVPKAGRLLLSGQRSLLDVLGDAGYGGKADQLRDRITLLREGRSLSLWAREVLSLRDPRWNIELQPEDVVVVHLPEQVTVAGEVVKPGAVSLPPVGSMSIIEALTLSGGLTEEADVRRARILRDWGARVEVFDLNDVLFAGGAEPDPLTAGDTLSISAGKPTKVFVFGMVDTPGLQRYSGRVRLAEAVSQANPKQFGALLSDAKLVRGWPDSPEVLAVDLDRLLFQHDARLNVELRDGDVVYIPETVLSDVLDVLARTLGPLSGPIQAAGQLVQAGNN